MKAYSVSLKWSVAVLGVVVVLGGCDRKIDNTLNFTNAINSYYSAHPTCLWPDPVQFPVQANASDTDKTSDYDALVDQGLLVRTTAEKRVMIVASKRVNNYDLSDKGRSAWAADPNQPGYGNFCYGHRKVSNIDSFTPTTSKVGATTQVAYHYTFVDVPSWAQAPETQTAYPQLHSDLVGPLSATATLANTSSGWRLAAGAGSNAGKIVE